MERKKQEWKCDHVFLLTAGIPFALFVPLLWWAREHQHSATDIAITHHIQKMHPPFLCTVVKIANVCLCSDASLNVLVVPVALLLWKMHLRLEALMTIAMCWTSTLVRGGIKRLVARPRPSPLLVHVKNQSKGLSFPSGDVASSVGLWGWLCALGLLHRSALLPEKKTFLEFPSAPDCPGGSCTDLSG